MNDSSYHDMVAAVGWDRRESRRYLHTDELGITSYRDGYSRSSRYPATPRAV